MDNSDGVLTLPALGQDVQLGMLYDIRTASFFGGVSLWNDNVVNAKQAVDANAVQNAEFTYSYSLEEARNLASLDAEGSLNLDFGIVKAKGAATYLNAKKSSTFEVNANISCTIVVRTRRIPQEILASMQHERYLQDTRYTHFVAEVTEGGSATLSFSQSCASSEDAKKVRGDMEAIIVKIPVGRGIKIESSKDSEFSKDNLKISYSGAIVESVSNMKDARRVASEMPMKLRGQLNTLSYKLLPLTVLENTVTRNIHDLDAALITKTTAALNAGTMSRLKLKDLQEQDVFPKSFSTIKQQVSNMQTTIAAAETEFTQVVRRLLPEMRDGTTDYSEKSSELQMAVALFEQRTRIVEDFIAKKCSEACVIRATIASLLAEGFEDCLDETTMRSLTNVDAPRLLLTFGGASISRTQHPLQKKVRLSKIEAITSDSDDSSDADDDEWFEDSQIVANLRGACTALRELRLAALASVNFGVAKIDKAYRPGREKRVKTRVGDIVLDHKNRFLIVTGMLPEAPTAPKLTIKDQTITVALCHERSEAEELALPAIGFVVRFRPRPNIHKDGAFPPATENEVFTTIYCQASATTVDITRGAHGGPLFDGCDYEVELSLNTIVGCSQWSKTVIGRTLRLPSVASRMIQFYNDNHGALTSLKQDSRWELCSFGGKHTLFLGHKLQALRRCTDTRFKGQLAVRVVDVAPEFEPDIPAADLRDQDKTIVAVFTGCTGHGKSTEVNAFVSYLLGGELDDLARILVIDDRGVLPGRSVTQCVTCYRIRPLSPLFNGKTLIIVDTPGYGDTRGPERDMFVTVAMSEFFKIVEHVNAIIFTCKANETRTTLLSPTSTYVFSLFAKDVRSCLHTIYTFSDAGAPLARRALESLDWPVQNADVEVNNAAFAIELDPRNQDKVRDWWLMSIKGQFRAMKMLLGKPAVPTAMSASVTQNRLKLEEKCELVEFKILRTASDARNLIANLGALAKAVGAAPTDTIKVKEDRSVEKPLPAGKATTLCLTCNHTCHDICIFSDDKEKSRCVAMNNDNCTMCKGRCHCRSTEMQNTRL